tara:strand:- start:44 stop:1399 length:1356 start_codon:yes stop_codon:yes gene_type:complete
MGGKKKSRPKKKRTKLQEAAAKRHANFKRIAKETGKRVQTFGGTKKNYTKSEARAIEKAGLSFSKVTGGAKNPLNRAPTNQGVKTGEMKKEFDTPLSKIDYSAFEGAMKGNPFAPGAPTGPSFSDSLRMSGSRGARFNEAGRNDLTTDKNVASSFAAGSGLFGNDIDVGDGVFRTKDQIIKMRDNPQNYDLEPGSRLFKQIQEAGKGLVSAPNTSGTLIAAADPTQLTGLGSTPSSPYTSTTGLDSVIRQGLGMDTTSGGLNIGGNFRLSAAESDRLGRVFSSTPSNKMLSEGGDLRFSDMFDADTLGATITKGINTFKNKIPVINMLPDLKINSVAEEAQRRYLGYNPNFPSNVLKQNRSRGSRLVGAQGVRQLPISQTSQAAAVPPIIPQASGSGTNLQNLQNIQNQAYNQQMSIYGSPNYTARLQSIQNIRPLSQRQIFNRDYFSQFV